jgi:hypothetical protein
LQPEQVDQIETESRWRALKEMNEKDEKSMTCKKMTITRFSWVGQLRIGARSTETNHCSWRLINNFAISGK